MIKFITILLLLTGKLYAASAQDTLTIEPEIHYDIIQELKQQDSNGGSVKLNSSQKINNLLHLHVNQNKRNKSFSGYRIQIYSSNSLGCDITQLKQIRDNFEKNFPDVPAYLKYFDPDFKIRIGNFHSRLECIPTLHRIKKMYPASYPVKTDITLDELKRVPLQDIPIVEENPEFTTEK